MARLTELDRFQFEAAIASRPEYWHVSNLRFVYGAGGELPNTQFWGEETDGDSRKTVWFAWSKNGRGYPLRPPMKDELPQFVRQGESIWQYSGEPEQGK